MALTEDPILPLVLTWLPMPELASAASVCHCWHASQLEVLAAVYQLAAGDMPTLSLSSCSDVSDVRFGAECGPVHAGGPNPITAFDTRVRRGCVAGGDMRVSRVDWQRFEKFNNAALAAMIGLPKQAADGQSTAKWDDIDIGWKFWATVVSAIRAAAWSDAEGAQWTWTERSCRGNRADLLICRRIVWIFCRPADDLNELKCTASISQETPALEELASGHESGAKGYIPSAVSGDLGERQTPNTYWSISVRAEQHLQLLR